MKIELIEPSAHESEEEMSSHDLSEEENQKDLLAFQDNVEERLASQRDRVQKLD